MITFETVSSWSGDNPEKDPTFLLKRISKFIEKEPNAAAFISFTVGMVGIENPVTASLLALAMYEGMRQSQEDSEALAKQIGGQNKQKREGSA